MNLIDRVAYSNRLTQRSAAEKAAFALGMLLLAVLLPPWPAGLIVMGVMFAATLGVARVPVRVYGGLVFAALVFLAFGVAPLLVAIEFGGRWLVSFSWAPDGIDLATRVVLRSLASVSCLFFLSLTTPVPQLLGVMRRLRVPGTLTEVSLLVYRNIWLYLDVVRSIRAAQTARLGYRTTRSSYRSLAMLISVCFARALQKARTMEHGLQARNWQGEFRVLDEGVAATRCGMLVVAAAQACTLTVGLLAWRMML